MAREPTKLVLGRGEVFFDRFLPGTRIGEGERYLGNTPSFRIQRDVKRLDRATAYGGRKVMSPGAVTSEENSINFTTDHIDIENLSMWFGGEAKTAFSSTTPTAGAITESFPVKRGRFYQLGKSVQPLGTPNITYLFVYLNGVPLNAIGNFRLDATRGRIEILSDAVAVEDGDVMQVNFQVRPANGSILESAPKNLIGALRFVAHNEGVRGRPQNDLYFPMVSITPRGQVDMKTDEWQQWSFDADAMNLHPGVQQVYVLRNSTSVPGQVTDEAAIIEEFGSLTPFPYWDDQLHQIINYDWPPAVDFTGI